MAVLTPDAVTTAVATQLGTVTGVGLVHQYRRLVRSEQDAYARWFHAPTNKLNAWQVYIGDDNPAISERHPGFGAVGSGQAGTVMTVFQITIDAIYGIDDANASEKTFRDLCWAVALSFNRIGLLTADVVHQTSFQWEKFGYLVLVDMFAMHYARFSCAFKGKSA